MRKPVLVHSCCNPEVLPRIVFRSSSEVFVQSPERVCRCKLHVSFHQRDEMRANGEIFVIVRDTVPEWREVIVRRKLPRVPRADSITARNIVAQACGNTYQIERIAEYGILNAAFLVEIGAMLC